MIRLSKIAHCLNGHTFREKPSEKQGGGLHVLQVGDVGNDGVIDWARVTKVDIEIPHKKFLLRDGDLVFKGRGANFGVSLITELDVPTIVASPLVRIVTDSDKLLPGYLQWLLQSPSFQASLRRGAQGTLVKSVGIRELESLEIPVPSLDIQKKIINTANLLTREADLLESIKEKREQYINALLVQKAHDNYEERKRA